MRRVIRKRRGEEMGMKNEIVLFETEDKEIKLNVPIEDETVWLSQTQMAELFDRNQSVTHSGS